MHTNSLCTGKCGNIFTEFPLLQLLHVRSSDITKANKTSWALFIPLPSPNHLHKLSFLHFIRISADLQCWKLLQTQAFFFNLEGHRCEGQQKKGEYQLVLPRPRKGTTGRVSLVHPKPLRTWGYNFYIYRYTSTQKKVKKHWSKLYAYTFPSESSHLYLIKSLYVLV